MNLLVLPVGARRREKPGASRPPTNPRMADYVDTAVRVVFISTDDLRKEGIGLMRAYALEMEPGLADILDPDWETYRAMEAAGRLLIAAAWVGDEEMVGFGMVCLMGRPEVRTSLHAYHQALYVTPEHRHGGVATALIETLSTRAEAGGATEIHMTSPLGSGFDGLLPKLGFAPIATVFRKELRA